MRDLSSPASSDATRPVVVIGAGIGGLATALRLVARDVPVLVLEAQAYPGGKMRQVDGVDAGPTVLTLRPVFDALFAEAGLRLDDHVQLTRQDILARHFWPDGSVLDLHADPDQSRRAVEVFAGGRAAREFTQFSHRARRLFDGFDAPMMQSAEPSLAALTAHVLRHPRLIRDMAPLSSLRGLLETSFSDPRLRQLFGRYATYVGGMPHRVPALLSLIWSAEEAGVWTVSGGLSALAHAVTAAIELKGGTVQFNASVAEIETHDARITGVRLADGTRVDCDQVVFNGDPRALATGRLGSGVSGIARPTTKAARSLSARVWAFRAEVSGPELAHHNVFFAKDPMEEFETLASGGNSVDPTLYLCAEDRGHDGPPPAHERFEIIINAPPLTAGSQPEEEFDACRHRTFQTLARMGTRMAPLPGPEALSTPRDFERLFPASAGALYGQSPSGTLAAFQRPTAKTAIQGLFLAGGATHPGAGVPMAALSGKHAAEAILTTRTSISASRPVAMRGGMSTG